MTNLVKVYDRSGEMFEMSHGNAEDAIRHLGWSKNKPATAKAEVKVEAPVTEEEEEASEDFFEEKEDALPKRGRPAKTK
jgi:hypothetical protein